MSPVKLKLMVVENEFTLDFAVSTTVTVPASLKLDPLSTMFVPTMDTYEGTVFREY